MAHDRYPTQEVEDAFMAEYLELCKKYQVCIAACGCCSSPWLVTAEESDDYGQSIPSRRELGLSEPPPEYDFKLGPS